MLQRLDQFAVVGTAQANRVPAWAAGTHALAVGVRRDRPEEIALAAPLPDVRRLVGQKDIRSEGVRKDEQAQVTGAEQLRPEPQPFQVFALRPALPDAPLPAFLPA